MKELMPKNVKNIKKYRGKIPLFYNANIEKELNNIYEPTVKLKSGGYLVINPTEALVAVDINSGQSTKQINIEKTALNTNLEAAEEIAHQIKLRDLSGLIVIDFIDMMTLLFLYMLVCYSLFRFGFHFHHSYFPFGYLLVNYLD